jgi:DNA-binding response OmpR family regulator
MRIVIVEDDVKIAQALKLGLSRQGYEVILFHDGATAARELPESSADLYIIDRMLPGIVDGTELIQGLRSAKIATPVLMLTAKGRVLDKVEGLNAGADDYLVKPFAFIELLARVRALLRRPPSALSEGELVYETIVMNQTTKEVQRCGKVVELSQLEYTILEYFLRRPERIVTKDELIANVWPYDSNVLPNTVEVYVGYVRNKIEKQLGLQTILQTKRGFGYMLNSKEEKKRSINQVLRDTMRKK